MCEQEPRALRDYIPYPQERVVVNLLLELSASVDLGRCGNSIGERFKCDARRLVEHPAPASALSSETDEFHKRPFI